MLHCNCFCSMLHQRELKDCLTLLKIKLKIIVVAHEPIIMSYE